MEVLKSYTSTCITECPVKTETELQRGPREPKAWSYPLSRTIKSIQEYKNNKSRDACFLATWWTSNLD